jgi:hypothetical protein
MQALTLHGRWEMPWFWAFGLMLWIGIITCGLMKDKLVFTNRFISDFFIKRMFKQKIHVSHVTFLFLCEKWFHIYKDRIHVWKRAFAKSIIVMSLQKFRVKNTLCNVEKIYGWLNLQFQSLWENCVDFLSSFVMIICSIFNWKPIWGFGKWIWST